MSAIAEDVHEKVKVLFLMYAGMDAIDVCGPLQVFGSAQHEMGNESEWNLQSKALHCSNYP
jgi:hypothetical protein